MNKQKHTGIAVYPINKWVNLWVEKRNGKDFSWRVSTRAPEDQLDITPSQMTAITESGLTSNAKGVFFFLYHHRFSKTRVCLYGVGQIAKMYDCAENTVRKVIRELEDFGVIGQLKIHTNSHVSHQYFIKSYKDWILPRNRRINPQITVPSKVIEIE